MTRSRKRRFRRGFTLIELLVVIATVAILAGLLMPALNGAKERAKMTKCLNNLHQIHVAIRMYMDDYNDRFPPVSGQGWVSFRLGGGDPDPAVGARFGLETATNRVLWPFTHSKELYRCPSDKGMNFAPFMQPFDSSFKTVGSSYKYNDSPWPDRVRLPMAGGFVGLAGKPESWIAEPSRFVLMHEPPATPYWDGGWFYFFWHNARGKSTAFSLAQAKDPMISPVLFVDGHIRQIDFTKEINRNPDYPSEATPEWIFYKPAR